MVKGHQEIKEKGGEMFEDLKIRLRKLLGRKSPSQLDLPVLLSNEEMEYLKEKEKSIVPEKPVRTPVLVGSLQTLWKRSKPIQYPENNTFLRSRIVNNGPRCLHCYSDQFYEGPQGGMAVNIKCAGEACGWVYWYGGELGLRILRRESPGPFTFQSV